MRRFTALFLTATVSCTTGDLEDDRDSAESATAEISASDLAELGLTKGGAGVGGVTGAVLRIANDFDEQALVERVGITRHAAQAIVTYRAGVDPADPADDLRVQTIAELDSIPYTGIVFFRRMVAFAEATSVVPLRPGFRAATFRGCSSTVQFAGGPRETSRDELVLWLRADESAGTTRAAQLGPAKGTISRVAYPGGGWVGRLRDDRMADPGRTTIVDLQLSERENMLSAQITVITHSENERGYSPVRATTFHTTASPNSPCL